MPLRVSAISFLNPAPLLYNFAHEPEATNLRGRYSLHYTTPAQCAAELHANQADLGLIPIAELTPDLAVVPGCTIASLRTVRSILLLVRCPASFTREQALRGVRTIAADRASRSSVAYIKTILAQFLATYPAFYEEQADALTMLEHHDAALIIGDPALLARERRAELEAGALTSPSEQIFWLDVAELWHEYTGLPWVAAVWAVRPQALVHDDISSAALVQDLVQSRDAGLLHTEQLVAEWLPRLPLSAETIRNYLTHHIYYKLDEPCLRAIRLFRDLAARSGALPALPELHLLQS